MKVSSLQYSMKGKVRGQVEEWRRQRLARHCSQGEVFIDMSNLWKSSSKEQQRLLAAVRQSGVFAYDRMDTFVKFNYRAMENKNMNYHTVFQKTLAQRNKLKLERPALRGTINVNQLWSERQLQDVLGSLPYPKDRLKVLHSYQDGKTMRVRRLRAKQIEAEVYRI